MPGDDISRTFKRCRSAINVNDLTLRTVAREINLAETLLLEYLKEISANRKDAVGSSSEIAALDHLSRLVVTELEYLRRVKDSEVVNVSGHFVTFRSNEGEFLVTVVPEEELQRNFSPLFCISDNLKPRFAKPVESCENYATASSSVESVYYDALFELPNQVSQLPPETSAFGRSIYGLLNYIFASTIGKMEGADCQM